MKLQARANRLGIYVLYDQKGAVDRYSTFFLEQFSKTVSELIVVCDAEVAKEEREKLKPFTLNILARSLKEPGGYDLKKTFDDCGWDRLCGFDEVVVVTSDLMGPVYPLDEMFGAMKGMDLDFWGVAIKSDETENRAAYIPFDFIAFRSSLICSREFKDYWSGLQKEKAGESREALFTKYFSAKGFQWDTYVDTDDLRSLSAELLLYYPKKLLERHCPVFDRRTFTFDYNQFIQNTAGQPAAELYDYLLHHTNYDADMIWETLLRTSHHSDISKNMHLNFVLPSAASDKKKMNEVIKTKRIALFMHLYFEDMIDYLLQYAKSMPAAADIYITTDTLQKKEKIERSFAKLKCNHLEVRLVENRGKDVSAFLVGVKDVIGRYEYFCLAHDKKSVHMKPASLGESFAYKCFENTLCSPDYVYNIIETFENNPRLGLLCPPGPNHGPYFIGLGMEWSGNFERTRKLAGQLKIGVPMSEDKQPMAPWGSFFWARPAALKRLFAVDWQYSDFPKDLSRPDGTLLHAIERIYPYAAQQEGYFSAIAMTDTFARIEYTNLRHFVRGYNVSLIEHGIFGPYKHMRQKLDSELQLSGLAEEGIKEKQLVAKRMEEIKFWKQTADERLEDILNKQKQMDEMSRKISDLQGEIIRLMPQTSLKGQIRMRIARVAKAVRPFKKAKKNQE